MCLNVIVPTFRCDVKMLRSITALKSSDTGTSVQILVVVDNPEAMKQLRSSDAVHGHQDYTPNHLVRVHINEVNLGASASRNTGIAASCGDWLVLLDDDIIPEVALLDSYLGAIKRNPTAHIFVGQTALPVPQSLMQQALMASQMTFFYDVSTRMKHPPWGKHTTSRLGPFGSVIPDLFAHTDTNAAGVTANLCVRGRISERVVWFSDCYPRTGGGEDVDFCLRIKDLLPLHVRTEAVVAVPEARVLHPFWNNISRQVIGWALGDVLCLSQLPMR